MKSLSTCLCILPALFCLTRADQTWLLTLALWAGLSVGLNGLPARATGLRAGVARIDITPSQPVMLAGYASRKEVQSSPFAPGAGEQLIEAALQGLRDLQ